MNERRRDRAIEQTHAAACKVLAQAERSAEADAFTHQVLTGTATRLMLINWSGCLLAAFAGCALFHVMLGR
jgi:hypothetical protein